MRRKILKKKRKTHSRSKKTIAASGKSGQINDGEPAHLLLGDEASGTLQYQVCEQRQEGDHAPKHLHLGKAGPNPAPALGFCKQTTQTAGLNEGPGG
jgi:hypothetical protein